MTAKENEQTRDASDDELGEFLGDLFKSHRQLMARRQRSDDEALQFWKKCFAALAAAIVNRNDESPTTKTR